MLELSLSYILRLTMFYMACRLMVLLLYSHVA